MNCYNCDTRNPDSARFCVICGKPLFKAHAPTLTQTPAAGSATAGYTAPILAPFGPGLATASANTTVVQHIYVNQGQPQVSVAQPGVNLLIRAIWFLFIGLWLGQAWLLVAWLLNLSVIGLPLGVWMLNRMPQVMTLRSQPTNISVPQQGAMFAVQRADAPHFAVRAIYFVMIGWWLSFLWFQLAWTFAATLIGLPLAFLMFERSETVTTLGT